MFLYGLIGKSLSHSFSQRFFTEKFKRENIAASYELWELAQIHSLLTLLQNPDIQGFNVTIPYKTEILPFLDEIADEARLVGAVNTVKRLENGKWKGFNTDVIGFDETLRSVLEENVPATAYILGTGGAAKSVYYVLYHNTSISDIKFVSRNPISSNHISYENLLESSIKNALIVQTTPIGMYPNVEEKPIFPYESVNSENFVIDLIYNPLETLFLSLCKEKGAKIANGLQMLHSQAEAAWEIWKQNE